MHDETGYNYRLPNINSALGCAQLEQMDTFIKAKRTLASRYAEALSGGELQFVTEPKGCRSNYWLNAVICEDRGQRDTLLAESNQQRIMTRPAWTLMNHLPMYEHCYRGDLSNAEWLVERLVNLPSSVLPEFVS
jgi:dTDP-4-amino-4,6-dideoxygalactose transaminase